MVSLSARTAATAETILSENCCHICTDAKNRGKGKFIRNGCKPQIVNKKLVYGHVFTAHKMALTALMFWVEFILWLINTYYPKSFQVLSQTL